MRKFKDSKILGYTAKQLYELVLDVEQYDKFVPWCSKCEVISKSEGQITADLSVKSGFISKSYRSSIAHGSNLDGYFIEINQISGPFKYLDTKWYFKKMDDAKTKVDFAIDFEFESEIINMVIGGIFSNTSEKIIEAFEKRAKEIYG